MDTSGKPRAVTAAACALAVTLSAAAASADEPEREQDHWSPSRLGASAVFGAHGSLVQSLGGDGTDSDGAGAAGLWIDVNALSAPWDRSQTLRFSLHGSLGGGLAGFEGILGSEGAFGFRWSERIGNVGGEGVDLSGDPGHTARRGDVWHALAGRVGYSFHLAHDEHQETSMVEVPRLELGYQVLGGHGFAMEARAHGGLLLTGMFSGREGDRELTTSAGWGSRIVLQGRSGKIDAGFTRYQPLDGDDLGPLDVADARICVFTSREPEPTAGICATGRMERGEVRAPGDRIFEMTTVHAGLLIGVGVH